MSAADRHGYPKFPRVLYVVGVQNSGSTMLDAILGNAPGVASLGEFGVFQSIRLGGACDCRRPTIPCEPCQTVLKELQREPSSMELLDAPMGGRKLRWLVFSSAERRRYAEVTARTLDAAARATTADVVVDSSKNVARAAAVLADGRHDVRIIHIVRDPRGYVDSRVRRSQHYQTEARHGRLLAHWFGKNAMAAVAIRARARNRYLLVRYEDLVQDTAATLHRIGVFADIDVEGLAERALSEGVERRHFYEPRRRLDYRRVRIDTDRMRRQHWAPEAEKRFWRRGGFVAQFWGYHKMQDRQRQQ